MELAEVQLVTEQVHFDNSQLQTGEELTWPRAIPARALPNPTQVNPLESLANPLESGAPLATAN